MDSLPAFVVSFTPTYSNCMFSSFRQPAGRGWPSTELTPTAIVLICLPDCLHYQPTFYPKAQLFDWLISWSEHGICRGFADKERHGKQSFNTERRLTEIKLISSSLLSCRISSVTEDSRLPFGHFFLSCKRPTSRQQTGQPKPVGAGPTPALWQSWQKRKRMKEVLQEGQKLQP